MCFIFKVVHYFFHPHVINDDSPSPHEVGRLSQIIISKHSCFELNNLTLPTDLVDGIPPVLKNMDQHST